MPDIRYSAIFDPLRHREEDFEPPEGVQGGLVGDMASGILGVYIASDPAAAARLEYAFEQCATVVRWRKLKEQK